MGTEDVENLSDAVNRIESLFDGLPNLPVPLGGMISSYLMRKRIKRLEYVIEVLSKRLSLCSQAVQRSRLESDEFLHLSVLTLERLQFEHRNYKLTCFALFIANQLISPLPIKFEQQKHLLSCIDKLDLHHLKILHHLEGVGFLAKDDDGWQAWKAILKSAGLTGDSSDDLVCAAVASMGELGLIKTKGSNKIMFGTNPTGLWHTSQYSITELGMQLVAMINSDDSASSPLDCESYV